MNVKNTETVGLWLEYLICKLQNIPFNSTRNYIKDLDYKIPGLEEGLKFLLKDIDIEEHIGQDNMSHDFSIKGGFLSIKSNITNDKVCPPNVGQTTLQKLDIGTPLEYKSWVLTNPSSVFDFYSSSLFKSTYTIYVNFNKGIICRIPSQDFKTYRDSMFTFTKTIDSWVESCTMKLNNVSVAEFQVHSNRNCVKCRFNMSGLSKMITCETKNFEKTKFKVGKSIGTFNYIGSKTNLLEFIKTSIEDYTSKPLRSIQSFHDLFSGTGSVSSYLIKNGCKNIITNDVMYYSYILTSCLTLKNIDSKKIKESIELLNNIEPLKGYIYRTYCDSRMYFTKENGMLIDSMRTWIEENKDTHTREEYHLLIKILLYACTKVANISSTYGAYLKKFKKSSTVKIKLNTCILEELFDENVEVSCYNDNIQNLKEIKGDVCYLDPPYNTRKYSSNYFVMESIAKYDKAEVSDGVTGIPKVEPKGSSSFCSKMVVKDSFDLLFKKIKTKFIFISYSSDGLLKKQEMLDLLHKNSWNNVKVYEQEYRKFKSNNSGNQEKSVAEYLFSATSL